MNELGKESLPPARPPARLPALGYFALIKKCGNFQQWHFFIV
jgi:hypothetical protein